MHLRNFAAAQYRTYVTGYLYVLSCNVLLLYCTCANRILQSFVINKKLLSYSFKRKALHTRSWNALFWKERIIKPLSFMHMHHNLTQNRPDTLLCDFLFYNNYNQNIKINKRKSAKLCYFRA